MCEKALVPSPKAKKCWGQVEEFETLACTSGRATDQDPSTSTARSPGRIGLAVAYVLLAHLTKSLWD